MNFSLQTFNEIWLAGMITLVFLGLLLLIAVPGNSHAQQLENATGYIPETARELAKIPTVRRYRDFAPPKFDLTRFTPKPGSQGENASCVGWAVAYAARTMQFALDNEVNPTQSRNIASPAALYNSVYSRADCTVGTKISDALDYMQIIGVPSVADFPHNKSGQCFRSLGDEDYTSAERFKIRSYSKIDPPGDITRIRGQIAQQKPVIFGMKLPKSFHKHADKDVFRDTDADEKSGHAMTIIGYDNSVPPSGAFKVMNSWGTDWGNEGYRWISYGAFSKLAYSAFVMETRPHKKATPLPSPNPDPPDDDGTPLEIAQQIAGQFECAGISAFDQSGQSVTAFAKTDEAAVSMQELLRGRLQGFEVNTVSAPWPQCEALLTLAKPLSEAAGLTLKVNGHEAKQEPLVLREGDPITIEITTPDFPSYLYAAYLETDDEGLHEAVHLLQSTSPFDQLPPRTQKTIGEGQFTVGGPNFGRELIILIASAGPLYDAPRPDVEIERDYLSGIGDALALGMNVGSARQIAAQVFPVLTMQRE